MEGRDGVERFKAEIENWMTLPINWLQCDFFAFDFGPQGKALPDSLLYGL